MVFNYCLLFSLSDPQLSQCWEVDHSCYHRTCGHLDIQIWI